MSAYEPKHHSVLDKNQGLLQMLGKSFAKDFDEKISSSFIDFSRLPRHQAIYQEIDRLSEKKLR